MALKCEDYSKVCVLEVEGDFSGDTAQAARQQVHDQVTQRQITDFVVDFAHCRFIDSDGLEALLWIKRRSEDLMGQFKIAQADPGVLKIFEITRLSHRFECHEDLASALKTMH